MTGFAQSGDTQNQTERVRTTSHEARFADEISAKLELRREQTEFRKTLSPVSFDGTRYKLLPILEWTSKDVYEYLDSHNLPYHPLFDEGYVTVGDWHSSRPVNAADKNDRDTRFRGLRQECGIHLPQTVTQNLALTA